MKILFLTIGLPDMSRNGGGLYADLIHELSNHGNEVTAVAPCLEKENIGLFQEGDIRVIRVRMSEFVGDIPFYKKIIGILRMNPLYLSYCRKYLKGESFDWILMPTPPASLVNVVEPLKNEFKAKFYIILRDIQPECRERTPIPAISKRKDLYPECLEPFPTNGLMKWYLKRVAQRSYKIADKIGCMSIGNIDFVKSIAPYLKKDVPVLLPNWYMEPSRIDGVNDYAIRKKYSLDGKVIAIFGGTIGQAQAVWNIAALAKHNLEKNDFVILVVGRGVYKNVLKNMVERDNLTNIIILDYMPREDYEQILQTADIGLISIDEKYKVPTCPSKIIGYMALKKPVLAMFNEGSDYGDYYMGGNVCGLWSTGLDNEKMFANFDWLYSHPEERKRMGEAGYEYFKKNFDVKVVAEELCKQLKNG